MVPSWDLTFAQTTPRETSVPPLVVSHLCGSFLERGTMLFNLPCRQDLEGIVAMHADHRIQPGYKYEEYCSDRVFGYSYRLQKGSS